MSWMLPVSMCNVGVVAIAYLLGSVSFAVCVSALMRLPDPRAFGSNNPGATNVLRGGSKLAAILTLLGDGFKGFAAVWLAQRCGSHTEVLVAWAACAVLIGHMYPIFFHFKGGKGVATAAGIVWAIDVSMGAVMVVVWLAVALIFRYSSLAALVCALFMPFYQIASSGWGPLSVAAIFMSIALIYRHRSNIQNLCARRESRIGRR